MFTKISGKYLAIEGVIGVGKTTLVKLLAEKYSLQYSLEVVEENPFLPRFYDNMDRWAFQTQLFFLVSRFDQQNELSKNILKGPGVISDYIFEKDYLFADLTLKGDHMTLYKRIFNLLNEQIPIPDLIIYLYSDIDVLMKRIAQRDRPFERSIDINYISLLAETYENFFASYSRTPVLRINTTEMDFVKSGDDLAKIYKMIEERFN